MQTATVQTAWLFTLYLIVLTSERLRWHHNSTDSPYRCGPSTTSPTGHPPLCIPAISTSSQLRFPPTQPVMCDHGTAILIVLITTTTEHSMTRVDNCPSVTPGAISWQLPSVRTVRSPVRGWSGRLARYQRIVPTGVTSWPNPRHASQDIHAIWWARHNQLPMMLLSEIGYGLCPW